MKQHICTDYSLRVGWLSPQGVFYKCSRGGHYLLAEILLKRLYAIVEHENPERVLEIRGWIKLFQVWEGGDCMFGYVGLRITAKQVEAIVAWCEFHNEELPIFLKYKEG